MKRLLAILTILSLVAVMVINDLPPAKDADKVKTNRVCAERRHNG